MMSFACLRFCVGTSSFSFLDVREIGRANVIVAAAIKEVTSAKQIQLRQIVD
jgi:hypothetical protein